MICDEFALTDTDGGGSLPSTAGEDLLMERWGFEREVILSLGSLLITLSSSREWLEASDGCDEYACTCWMYGM